MNIKLSIPTSSKLEKIVISLKEKLVELKNKFSFQKVNDIEVNNQSVSFEITTKMGTIIRVTITLLDFNSETLIEVYPDNAPFISLITTGLEKGIRDVLSE